MPCWTLKAVTHLWIKSCVKSFRQRWKLWSWSSPPWWGKIQLWGVKDYVISKSEVSPKTFPSAYMRDFIPLERTHIPTCQTAQKWKHLVNMAEEIPPLMDWCGIIDWLWLLQSADTKKKSSLGVTTSPRKPDKIRWFSTALQSTKAPH